MSTGCCVSRFLSSFLCSYVLAFVFFFFFFNDTATTEIYTLSLHDALPIYLGWDRPGQPYGRRGRYRDRCRIRRVEMLRDQADRKSTRLNSSHSQISYAVFCLKKKKTNYELICS